MARVVSIPISHEIWQDMMTKGNIVKKFECIEGLPEGAEYIHNFYDGWRNTVYLVYRHDSFDDVHLGEQMPRLRAVFQDVDD